MDRPRKTQSANRPGSRSDRIRELTRQIKAGAYMVPAEWVAESILTWRGRAGRRN